MKKCLTCGNNHNRKKFCSNKCKDKYHNLHNPRGFFSPNKKSLSNYTFNELIRMEEIDDYQQYDEYDPGDSEYYDSKDWD